MKTAHRVTVSVVTLALVAACGSGTAGGKTAGSGDAAGGKQTKLKIMVGGISKQIYLPNELTARLGYFTAEGLDVTLITRHPVSPPSSRS